MIANPPPSAKAAETDNTPAIGILPTGEPYEIRRATLADIDALYELQEHTLATLGEADRYFIVPKTRAQFEHYLTTIAEHVYTLRIDGAHAAQLIMRTDVAGVEHARHIAALGPLPAYGLVQGALVDPAFRGRHLLRLLLDHLDRDVAPALDIGLLLARVVPLNIPSWISFMQAGYHIEAAARDPDDEREVFYMHRTNPLPSLFAGEGMERASPQDFAHCRELTLAGWRGVSFERESGKLIFRRS